VSALDRGAYIDKQDARGRTALMTASTFGHVDVVRLLIERSADINKTDNHGNKAWVYAVRHHRAEVQELLEKAEIPILAKELFEQNDRFNAAEAKAEAKGRGERPRYSR